MLPELLTSERLLLSPPCLADATTIIELANDPLIAEMTLSVPYPYGEADAVHFLYMVRQGRLAENVFIYAIRSPNDRALMGAIGLHLDGKYGHAELGYWMGEPYRKRGYTSEAVGVLVEAGFRHTPVARIQAYHKDTNLASGRVMLANGLRREAVLEDYVIKNGVPQTVVQYRILRKEWTKEA